MKQCIICENVGYSDFQPMGFPLRNTLHYQLEKQSPNDDTSVRDITDNWRSPTFYKKQSYIPPVENKNANVQLYIKKHTTDQVLGDRNKLALSEDEKQNFKTNCIALIEVDKTEKGNVASIEKLKPQISQGNNTKTEKTGFINKVKNKFLSIFSSRPSNNTYETQRNERSDFSDWENEEDEFEYFDNYDLPARKVFERSVDIKTTSQDNLLKNLSETDAMYIKNFIKCFKQNKKEFNIVLNNTNEGGITSHNGNSPSIGKSAESMTTESCDIETTTIQQIITTAIFDHGQLSTPNSTSVGEKDDADTITVDLDINQKSGTGEVLMSDKKTTECTPIRLNDMNFDLEWNKNPKPLEFHPEKNNELNYPFLSNRQGHSLTVSDANKNEDEMKSERFFDSPQKVPDESDKPLKMSAKREAPLKSYSRKSKLAKHFRTVPDTALDVDYDYEIPAKDNQKRRTRFRGKFRSRTKAKHKSKNIPSNRSRKSNLEPVGSEENEDTKNSYKSFDELNDVQFRVNPDDEEAISKFIANLNSPPELLQFDIDKYLHSTDKENELETPKVQRSGNEFSDTPTLEVEQLPFVETSVAKSKGKPLSEERGITDKKRDLLKQYIKGFSNARLRNHPENCASIVKENGDKKSQRSSATNPNIPRSIENFYDKYNPRGSLNSDYSKTNQDDDFLDNYYLLNDGSAQIFNLEGKDLDEVESPKNYEVDKEFYRKFNDFDWRPLQEMHPEEPRQKYEAM